MNKFMIRIVDSFFLLFATFSDAFLVNRRRCCYQRPLHTLAPDQEGLVQKQKERSEAQQQLSAPVNNKGEHLQHQQAVFDDLSAVFASGETITDDLIPVYQALARRIIRAGCGEKNTSGGRPIRILDVACGTGALWPFLRSAAEEEKCGDLSVVGVDLSGKMVEAAIVCGEQLQQQPLNGTSTFYAVTSDIETFCSETTEEFDVAVVNACYANFWDPPAVLEGLCRIVQSTIIVSHPLSAQFVAELHKSDPITVPHVLPATPEDWRCDVLARRCLALRVVDDDRATTEPQYYWTQLQRSRARTLPNVIRLQGHVDRGYGRGGKKLGFPTANLPSRLFQSALESVDPGVYWGWAQVADPDSSVRKAVVNVGYSPTFEGMENPEKIVEAHIIVGDDDAPKLPDDFYGVSMRLLLIGFLRPEMKFPSFPDLIAQIRQDVADASDALDDDLASKFREDAIFRQTSWMALNGGSDDAAWEFEAIGSVLDAVL